MEISSSAEIEAELSADGYHARYPFDSTPPTNVATWRAMPSIESSDYSSSALSALPHIPADEDVTSPANPTMRQDTASGPAAPPNSSVDQLLQPQHLMGTCRKP